MTETPAECPCRSGQPFATCCGPHLSGAALPPTAEALMRSRYTAFRRGAVDYLRETRHPAHRKPDERAALARSVAQSEWLNLVIREARKGGPEDGEGTVTFVAAHRPRTGGEPGQMHERSFFMREEGRWFYTDGDPLPPWQPGRNDPCWCGSGKKAKKCHG